MKKQNILIGGLVILIICAVIFSLIFFGGKLTKRDENPNDTQLESNEYENINVENTGEEVLTYKVNIDIKDCLSKDEVKKLYDLGEYSDNEMLVYKNDDKDNPIEVWKIKVKDGQNATLLMRKISARRDAFIEEFKENVKLKELLESQNGNLLSRSEDVVTLIISSQLKEVENATVNWLKEEN